MSARRLFTIALLLATGSVYPAGAQPRRQPVQRPVQGPPDSVRGWLGQGSPARPQTFVANVDLGVGYDDNEIPQDTTTGEFAPIATGYTTWASTTLNYQRGRATRFVSADATTLLNYQQLGTDLNVNRLTSFSGAVAAGTELGRRATLRGALRGAYEPTYLFSAFETLETGEIAAPVPGEQVTAPPTAAVVTQQAWWSTDASGQVAYNWTPRQRMQLSYNDVRRRPITGIGIETRSNMVSLLHAWNGWPSAGFDFVYDFSNNPQLLADGVRVPLRTQAGEVRFRIQRGLSPTRNVVLSFAGGAIRTETRSVVEDRGLEFVGPTVSGGFRIDLWRDWQVSVDGRRSITVLDGFSPQPFKSDTGVFSIGGRVGAKLTLGASVSGSRGTAPEGTLGNFNLALANGSMLYGLSRYVGLNVSYSYYRHTFQNVVAGLIDVPNSYARNSVFVGMRLWLPLYGTF